MRRIFIGSDGIRAGWRLLIFLAIIAAEGAIVFVVLHALKVSMKPPKGHAMVMRPWPFALGELGQLAGVVFAAWVMSKIERRPFAQYGLPWRSAFRGQFWSGARVGLVTISAVVAAIVFAGGGRFSLAALTPAVISAFAGFTVAFVLVGCAEEFLFRGYPQFTLARGIGFWPAAVVLSAIFALVHGHNPMESPFGLAQVFVIGIVFCLMLLRTGTLWYPIGFHAAWDWGQTFLYGVPDSGLVPAASFMHVVLRGPAWFSGGTDGPEGSVLATIALIAVALFVAWRYPRDRYDLAERLQPYPPQRRVAGA